MSSVFCSPWRTGAEVFPFEKSSDWTKSECNGPADCVNPTQDELGEFMLILKDLPFDSLVSLLNLAFEHCQSMKTVLRLFFNPNGGG